MKINSLRYSKRSVTVFQSISRNTSEDSNFQELLFIRNVVIYPGAHLASYSMGTVGPDSVSKDPTDVRQRLRMRGATPPLPMFPGRA
jgi:hypothetical protein